MGTRTGTYYTGTISGTAGSLITALDAILVTGEGWTKLYTGTNKAVYQTAGGNGFVVRVVDDGSTSAGAAREAMVRGGESATDVDTLVDPFPSTALVSDALCCWRKSDTADSTARSYWAVADDRFMVMVVRFGTLGHDLYLFGDIEPVWSGDNYATVITVRNINNSAASGRASVNTVPDFGSSSASGVWFARTPSGLAKIDRGAFLTTDTGLIGNTQTPTLSDYPHPETGKLHFRMLALRSNATTAVAPADGATIRGCVPFMVEPILGTGVVGMVPYDTWTATDYDSGSEFIIMSEASTTVLTDTNMARYVLQIAGTWNPGY